MKFETYTPEDADAIITESRRQAARGIIDLRLFADLDKRLWLSSPSSKLIAARGTNGDIYGLMVHNTLAPGFSLGVHCTVLFKDDKEEIDPDEITFGNISAFGSYRGSTPLISLDLMESYARGAGTALVDKLREEGSAGIITFSTPSAVGFYEKVGFTHTGLFRDYDLTQNLMVWMR
jgi:hypothetical protein